MLALCAAVEWCGWYEGEIQSQSVQTDGQGRVPSIERDLGRDFGEGSGRDDEREGSRVLKILTSCHNSALLLLLLSDELLGNDT